MGQLCDYMMPGKSLVLPGAVQVAWGCERMISFSSNINFPSLSGPRHRSALKCLGAEKSARLP